MNEYDLTEKETNDLLADLIHKNESDELLEILNIRINDDTKKGYIEKYKCILPKRDDEKYLRIEQYANYEFTHCITYEMAIRNANVIKLSKLRDMLIILNNNNLTKEISHEEISHEEITIGGYKATCSHYKVTQRSTSNFINNINLEVLQNKYKEKNPLKFFNQISTKHKKEILNWLIEKVDEELDEKYLVIDDETYKSLSSDIYNHKINTVGNNSYLTNNIKDEHYKGFQGKSENSNKFNINKTIATFSQPLRIFNTMEISINPSLPLNDILSFVKKIKKDYDTKNSFKSFFELTIEDLIIDSDRKNTIGNAISYNKKKWADIFYIFDYFQFYLSKNNKINKGKTIYNKRNKEADETTIAKEISLQLSYYHILEEKTSLDFSESVDIGIQNSIYDMYDVDFQEKIKEQIKNNQNCSLLNYVNLPREIEKEISDKITAEIEKEIKDQIIAEKESKPIKEIIRDIAKYRKERIQKALNNKKEEKLQNTSMAYYITANHIRTDSYPRIKKLIQGNSPEYIKFVNGKNHDLDSFIDGENNTSSKLQ